MQSCLRDADSQCALWTSSGEVRAKSLDQSSLASAGAQWAVKKLSDSCRGTACYCSITILGGCVDINHAGAYSGDVVTSASLPVLVSTDTCTLASAGVHWASTYSQFLRWRCMLLLHPQQQLGTIASSISMDCIMAESADTVASALGSFDKSGKAFVSEALKLIDTNWAQDSKCRPTGHQAEGHGSDVSNIQHLLGCGDACYSSCGLRSV